MNRGVARRALFETAEDARHFLALAAREVRAGRIRVHAFTLMTTHFHLMVESPRADLSGVMRRIENPYVRWFNRRRRRDGPLVRGRFRSRRIRSDAYRRTLVAYIDRNPAEARLVRHGVAYPLGSARHYLRAHGPIWLERSWVEGTVCAARALTVYDPACYADVFSKKVQPAQLRWVAESIARGAIDSPSVDAVLRDVPGRVRAWLRRKIQLADGAPRGPVLVDVASAERGVRAATAALGPQVVRPGRKRHDGWALARVALLRDLCGLDLASIAARVGCTAPWVRARYDIYARALRADAGFAAAVADAAARAIRACHGPEPSRYGAATSAK